MPEVAMEPERYLAVGAALFVLGALGFLTRRNLILMILSSELMLHGVSLTLVTFGRMNHNLEGQAFTIFILTIAACEAGLALALILAMYHQAKTLDIEIWSSLREPDVQPPPDLSQEEPLNLPESQHFPLLTPAGRVPDPKAANGTPTIGSFSQSPRK